MNSQRLLNLDYLWRATNPQIPEIERQQMLENLSYAMSTDDDAMQWIFTTFADIRPEVLSDPILLWFADWVESLPPQTVRSETQKLVSHLWLPDGNQTTQARLFECAATLDSMIYESSSGRHMVASSEIFAKAIKHDARTESVDTVLALLDMVLSRYSFPLLSNFVALLRE